MKENQFTNQSFKLRTFVSKPLSIQNQSVFNSSLRRVWCDASCLDCESTGYMDTHPRQTNERLDEEAEEAPEVAQPQRQGRRSRARNMELTVAQMLEMQRQQVAQTAALNAYLQ
ncbi:hypothetical protein Fot_09482 [Forsythia ovata]|uniref:Uncharacterized protein n=1 Tax=Forsythia ovata TaxID=205694 RepID=A0ABD1WEF4_9LAMI